MSNWDQAQRDQWDNNYSEYSDEEGYSDEEEEDDAPLQISSWGTQTIDTHGTTNVSIPASSWASLIDPNFKVQANGIGSGQLHRKGGHYKPVDEQLIIDRRLGKPLPKGGLGGSKKKRGGGKSKKSGGPPPPRRAPLVPPSSSASRANRPAISQGAWATSNLASTPFWETANTANNTATNNYTPANNGIYASKYASAPPPKPVSAPQPPRPAPPPQQQQAPIPAPSSNTGFQGSALGSAASKWATPQVKQQAPPAPQPVAPSPPATQPVAPPPPASVNSEPTMTSFSIIPMIRTRVEVGPEVYAYVEIYEGDTVEQIVEDFLEDHSLTFNKAAKRFFCRQLEELIRNHKAQQQS